MLPYKFSPFNILIRLDSEGTPPILAKFAKFISQTNFACFLFQTILLRMNMISEDWRRKWLIFQQQIVIIIIMSNKETETILGMVDSIFQNIGYRRCMQGIECLKNEQIYFEICNIVFHSNSIQLIKINESNLSTGEKLQELINLVSRIINMDLSHISGRLIADGNISHAKNLLQLFEYLSHYFLIKNENPPSTVRSAPQADSQDEQQDIENLNHTVLGTRQEFGYTETDSETGSERKPEVRPRNASKPKDPAIRSKKNDDSEPEIQILKPTSDKNRKKLSSGSKKQNKQEDIPPNYSKKPAQKPRKEQSHGRSQQSTKAFQLPASSSHKRPSKQAALLELNQQVKISYANRLFCTIQDLQRKKIRDIRSAYTKREDEMIKVASQEQQQIQGNHKKLCSLLKQTKHFTRAASDNFAVDKKHFAKQLGRVLKASSKMDQEYRLRRLQKRNQELMEVIEDSGDIEEMQHMVKQIYKW